MGKTGKNIIAVLLCLLLPAIYAGCAKNNNVKNNNNIPDNTGASSGSGLPATAPPTGSTENNNSVQDKEPVEAEINVSRIDGLSEDFMCGADISSIKSEYESGVKYYDFDGNNLAYSPEEGEKGFFTFLRECGINWVRIRVWNSPYDENGNKYGGGVNDLETAMEIGKLATDAGIRVFIDFHYSDFWADPGKY